VAHRPAAVALHRSLRFRWVAKCADRQELTYTWVADQGSGWVREWNPPRTATPHDPEEERGAQLELGLLGQVLFLFSFDGVMLTVANDHRVQVVMFGLFNLCPGRPAQCIDEEEPGCLTAELLPLDLLL
jgi:hypothetical protein